MKEQINKNLIIRFGKIGDGITAFNLARTIGLKNFSTFGLNANAEQVGKFLTKEYLGELRIHQLAGKFNKIIIYNHPFPSLKKKFLST